LGHRAKLDGNGALKKFSGDLEKACIDAVQRDNVMTKDLALAIHGKK
jgi:isocitrate dehydrogenase